MIAGEFQRLYEYTSWAHERMFEVMAKLSQAQQTQELRSSYPTIRETFAHMVFAEWIWLQRWKGTNPTAQPSWYAEAGVDELATILRAVTSERKPLVDALDEGALSQSLEYRNMSGKPFTNRLSDVLFHVVNHASYHRGQLVTMIREVGGVPPNTDYIAFARLV